ncbi:AlpA family phage regulatory protein [Robbsia andropogonis]
MKNLPNKVGLSEPQIFKMMRDGQFSVSLSANRER